MIVLLTLFLPIVLQSLAMLFDEFHFHHKRGLPKWERIGHPFDTGLVIAAISVPLFFNFSAGSLAVYAGLAFLSSLAVTKDEFVHSEQCEPAENWLHSLLFILHPLVFLSIACFWMERDSRLLSDFLEIAPLDNVNNMILAYAATTAFFMLYQTVYWNFVWKKS